LLIIAKTSHFSKALNVLFDFWYRQEPDNNTISLKSVDPIL